MKEFIGRMTVKVKGHNAGDAIGRFLNPGLPGTEIEITAIGVEPMYEAPFYGQSTAAALQAESEAMIPEPDPVENDLPETHEEEAPVLPEADEGCCEEQEQLPLPDDFPYVKTLRREGENLGTVILKTQQGTLGDVKGMGANGVAKVTQYLQRTGRLPSHIEKETAQAEAAQAQAEAEFVAPTAAPVGSTVEPGEAAEVDTAKVRQALAEVAQKHQLPALKNLLKEFGANGLGDLKEEDYPAAYAKALELLNGS